MKYLNFLVLLTLISCGTGDLKNDFESSPGYRTSGVEQFILPELPQWANSSSSGDCFKVSSFHYLNFNKLKDAYQLSYSQMIELQAQYNERLENYFRSAAVRFLKPMEEASFFSNTLEQVRGGVKSLKLPEVKKVDILWLESYTTSEIKQMANSSRFDENPVILFSSCHSKQSLDQWIHEHKLEEVGFYLVSAEWLTPYSSANELKASLHLEIAELLNKDIKINLLKSENSTLTELILP
jgi:hypothetical protein